MVKEVGLKVVLIPNIDIQKVAMDTSQKISRDYKSDLTLDGEKAIPHITIYQGRFPEKNLDAMRFNMKIVANRTTPFEVRLNKFTIYKGKYIFWNSNFPKEFELLAKTVVYHTNHLREGLVIEELKKMDLSLGETYDMQTYGSVVVGKTIEPHLTISHLQDEDEAYRATQMLRPRPAHFTADRLYVGLSGRLGTLVEVIEEFPFKIPSDPIIGPEGQL